jgi:biopolymer transport protein ExbD
MTPLIDCIFTLMIVIMLVASFQSLTQIQMTLPEARTQDDKSTSNIVVQIDAQGNYFLDSEKIDAGQLEAALKPRIAASKEKVVTFCGDKQIPYHWFVKVVDAARTSGAVHIDIVHELPAKN